MVGIRKIPNRRFGGKAPSSSTYCTFRNFVLALVAMQGIRVLMGSFKQENSSPLPNKQSDPLGLEDRLKDSVGRVRKKPDTPETSKLQKPQKQEVAASKSEEDDEPKNPQEEWRDHEDARKQVDADAASSPDEDDEEPQSEHQADQSGGKDLNPIVIDKKGTGPTNVGYVKDFTHERENPPYRSVEISITDVSPTVASLAKERSVKPCETVGQDGTTVTNPSCLDPDTPLIAYNPESFSRTWCGQEIKPQSAVTMSEHCTEAVVHLFPTENPPISGEHMPPIVIKSKRGAEVPATSLTAVECNIPCQKDSALSGDDWFIDDEPWMIRHTMLDGWYEGHAKIERRDFLKNKYFSTQSWESSVPLTYFSFDKHSLRNRPAIDFDSAKDKAIYIVDNQCTAAATKRAKYFGAMKAKIEVHSYGQCGHNTDIPEGMTTDTPEGRIALMKQYRVVLAFDVTKSKDHVSEMVWEALMSGSVPVIVGADNLLEHLPPSSFINAGKFSNWDDLADYVKTVLVDKELWESYQKWRTDEEALAAFEAKYEFTRTIPECRICRWAYAKKYGLGWDHAKQQIRSMKLPREKFCTSADHGLISAPFSEIWVAKTGGDESTLQEDSEGEICSSLSIDGDVDVDSFKGHRQIIHHDGVTDFIITEANREHVDTEVVLRLLFPGIRNPDGAVFYNTHSLVSTVRGPKVSSATIQDAQMKVTVLADWETLVTSTGEGVVEIVIHNRDDESKEVAQSKRIRIIMEELASIHDKMTEFYPSSFGRRMTKDFVDPLGVFFSDS
ncbi:glycosyltransferase family 10 fucosyltransferase [Nitzschia inconspicua]|uniref:Fucosyltransferase n=1 Tax=Nitzschia inconspicua TaxID=303405 RepID=A0A9K3Q115_9STRA|nr:glycosyltransferase family 10 fucosyltransferase [Nitzschia inconspicua]KAG7367093.1 glycosyltransferase family 10 fucosyltransferase [Nitzschia inconspicua]